MRTHSALILAAVGGLLTAAVAGPPVVLDDFENLDAWRVITPEGVAARISPAEGRTGRALRLDFDFQTGGGFCVIRRELPLKLPENYRFSVTLHGAAGLNNLEFKLVDATGENVWWVNRRNYELPAKWRTLTQKARQFSFAWGPSGGARLTEIGALEIAIAAVAGGQGYVVLDNLTFEELSPPVPVRHRPLVTFSSGAGGAAEPIELGDDGALAWTHAPGDLDPWVQLDFQQVRELGGLLLVWDADYATAYDVLLSHDGTVWETAARVGSGNGGRDFVVLPEAEGRLLRVNIRAVSGGQCATLKALRLFPVEFAESPNNMYALIARESPRGWLPRYFLGEQQCWTVVGVDGDEHEALLDEAGALELDKGTARIEPLLVVDGRVFTWADVTPQCSLADGYLPIPSVSWELAGLACEVTAVADGAAGEAVLYARYRLRNVGADTRRGALVLAVRPFQVLPPWQDLNITGGAARVGTVRWDGARLWLNESKSIESRPMPAAIGAATFSQGEIVEYVAEERWPQVQEITCAAEHASAGLRYDFDLAPGAEQEVVVAIPFEAQCGKPTTEPFTAILARAKQTWAGKIERVALELPPAGAGVANTFRTMQAYILLNADGPAIQPGSRTYERSWIRDGALTSAALLYTGHPERVRAYIDWFSAHLFDSGKVPCVVDRRGPDPVPEHDSTGEYIHLLWRYYEFTHDRALLERHLSRVVAGVDYLERLRAERLTAEYRDGPPEKRACYGLVPESISHEGYSAKPMHSYWDSFFVVRGLADAARIAGVLEKPEFKQRFAGLRDAYRVSLYESLALTMRLKQIDFIPGCVELGDFDATSTAIAVFPCAETPYLPQPALNNTFERYMDYFRGRRDGALAWRDYTPYEIRIVGAFVHLGWPDRAHELLDYFMAHQRPPGWNHWAEVVYSDERAPRFIGDMPHTWVGAALINSVRSMFVYERERDEALVLAAGIRPTWLEGPGARIAGWPTAYGTLDYTARSAGDELVLEYKLDGDPPPGGLVICNPTDRPLRSATLDGRPVELPEDGALVVRSAHGRADMRLSD